jgi:N-acyl-phosphatidylethanolamine-hydrolysing phospholipase D
MRRRIGRTRFRNAHPHASHNVAGVLRWKLGLADEEPPAHLTSSENSAEADGAPAKHWSPAEPLIDSKIRLTWIGHSTFLIQHHGVNILTDPIFGDCQPLPVGRYRRVRAPGIRFEDLPPIHHVLISHSHYDHLDAPTIRALGNSCQYWVPQGLSGWLRKRRISMIHEFAWWQSGKLASDITVHCVPAQHASARTPFDRDQTHWCGWVLESPDRSLYFAGDTGYSPIFKEIGERFGGFDLAMIPIGAYKPRWLMHPMHTNPAEAVKVHTDIASRLSVACHFGTFRLADEPITEPPALLAQELATRGIEPGKFLTLSPGNYIDV